MDLSSVLSLLSRWFHIVPAIVLVGGTLMMRLAFLPAADIESPSEQFRESMRRQWAKWVGISTLLLLVSGFYNTYLKATSYQLPIWYNVLLLVKIVSAFGVFYLSALLAGRSQTAVKFRQREKHWTNIAVVLMLVVVLSAGAMKIFSGGLPAKIDGGDKTSSLVPRILNNLSPEAVCFSGKTELITHSHAK